MSRRCKKISKDQLADIYSLTGWKLKCLAIDGNAHLKDGLVRKIAFFVRLNAAMTNQLIGNSPSSIITFVINFSKLKNHFKSSIFIVRKSFYYKKRENISAYWVLRNPFNRK